MKRKSNLSFRTKKSSIHKWVIGGFVFLWGLFISGFLSSYTGSPGVLQAIRLQKLLKDRKQTLTRLEEHLVFLDQEKSKLDHDTVTQEREIRRVLGYAAPGEIIFEFTKVSSRDAR